MGVRVAQIGVPRPREEQGPVQGHIVPELGSGTRRPGSVGQNEGAFISCYLHNK